MKIFDIIIFILVLILLGIAGGYSARSASLIKQNLQYGMSPALQSARKLLVASSVMSFIAVAVTIAVLILFFVFGDQVAEKGRKKYIILALGIFLFVWVIIAGALAAAGAAKMKGAAGYGTGPTDKTAYNNAIIAAVILLLGMAVLFVTWLVLYLIRKPKRAQAVADELSKRAEDVKEYARKAKKEIGEAATKAQKKAAAAGAAVGAVAGAAATKIGQVAEQAAGEAKQLKRGGEEIFLDSDEYKRRRLESQYRENRKQERRDGDVITPGQAQVQREFLARAEEGAEEGPALIPPAPPVRRSNGSLPPVAAVPAPETIPTSERRSSTRVSTATAVIPQTPPAKTMPNPPLLAPPPGGSELAATRPQATPAIVWSGATKPITAAGQASPPRTIQSRSVRFAPESPVSGQTWGPAVLGQAAVPAPGTSAFTTPPPPPASTQ